MGLKKDVISSLTDAIASCRVGLGFLLADDPKIRFIVKASMTRAKYNTTR